MPDIWEAIFYGLMLAAVTAMLAMFAVDAFSHDPPVPPQQRVKQLDRQGNSWYIWGEGYRTPTDAVPYTCPSIGREVAEVVLAGKYSTEGTVRCK